MKVLLTIWISAVLIQEVIPSALVRKPRVAERKPSLVQTEYVANFEQKGLLGNQSQGRVTGKHEVVHDNCSDNWNSFADRCASLIKDLVASLANAVSSKPGDATNLQVQIKNTFRHFDNTHNCSCFNCTGQKLSDIDLNPIFENVSVTESSDIGKPGYNCCKLLEELQQKQPNRTLAGNGDSEVNPENAEDSGSLSNSNSRRQITHPKFTTIKPQTEFDDSSATYVPNLSDQSNAPLIAPHPSPYYGQPTVLPISSSQKNRILPSSDSHLTDPLYNVPVSQTAYPHGSQYPEVGYEKTYGDNNQPIIIVTPVPNQGQYTKRPTDTAYGSSSTTHIPNTSESTGLKWTMRNTGGQPQSSSTTQSMAGSGGQRQSYSTTSPSGTREQTQSSRTTPLTGSTGGQQQYSATTQSMGSTGGQQSSSTTPLSGSTGGQQSSTTTPSAGSTRGQQSSSTTPSSNSTGGLQSSSTTPSAGSTGGQQYSSTTQSMGSTGGQQQSSSTTPSSGSTGGQQSSSTTPSSDSTGGQQSSSTTSQSMGSTGGQQQSSSTTPSSDSTGGQQSSSTTPSDSTGGQQQSSSTTQSIGSTGGQQYSFNTQSMGGSEGQYSSTTQSGSTGGQQQQYSSTSPMPNQYGTAGPGSTNQPAGITGGSQHPFSTTPVPAFYTPTKSTGNADKTNQGLSSSTTPAKIYYGKPMTGSPAESESQKMGMTTTVKPTTNYYLDPYSGSQQERPVTYAPDTKFNNGKYPSSAQYPRPASPVPGSSVTTSPSQPSQQYPVVGPSKPQQYPFTTAPTQPQQQYTTPSTPLQQQYTTGPNQSQQYPGTSTQPQDQNTPTPILRPSPPGALIPGGQSQPNKEDQDSGYKQPTTFQTTSAEPTTSSSYPTPMRNSRPYPVTTILPNGSYQTLPMKPPTSPMTPETQEEEEDDDDDEDCCSWESRTEEEITDPRVFRENACKNLEEARRELKAIFNKIKKKLKCGRKALQPVATR